MHQNWTDYRVFWREFRQTYQSTGAVLPSGRALSAALSRYVRDAEQPATTSEKGDAFNATNAGRRILEVGPGTGAVTSQIVRDMHSHDQLTLVERNDQFIARLRHHLATAPIFQHVRDRVAVVHSVVEALPDDQPFDLIISGLPLNNFSAESVAHILGKFRRLLAPRGTLSFFEYVAIRWAKAIISRKQERERLNQIGRVLEEHVGPNELRRDLVLANVPPAWVHHVRFKNKSSTTTDN